MLRPCPQRPEEIRSFSSIGSRNRQDGGRRRAEYGRWRRCPRPHAFQRPTLRQSRVLIGGPMVLKIVYWATTSIAAAMLLMAVTYLTGSAQIVAAINHLGYPQHLRLVLGVAKPAAGVVLLLPGLRLLKEWA